MAAPDAAHDIDALSHSVAALALEPSFPRCAVPLAGGDEPSTTIFSLLKAAHTHHRGILGFFSHRDACISLRLVCTELRREVDEYDWPPTERDIPLLAGLLSSDDPRVLLRAAKGFRRMLSTEFIALPIDGVISAGVVPRFVELLSSSDGRVRYEACWVLTNIASGNSRQIEPVLSAHAVPLLVLWLDSTHDGEREQAVWALGNIAGTNVNTRDLVIASGVIGPLIRCLMSRFSFSLILRSAWLASNLCRGKPLPKVAIAAPLLSVLIMLLTSTDSQILSDVLWALSYLCDADDDRVQVFLDSGVPITRVVTLLDHAQLIVIEPALRIVGNLARGNEHQTQVVLDAGALAPVARLLSHASRRMRKEACWLFSNVCAGTSPQVQAVIDAQIMPLLIQCTSDAEESVRRFAMYSLLNSTFGVSAEQIGALVIVGVIHAFREALLREDYPAEQNQAVEGLANILRHEPPPSAGAPSSIKRAMTEAHVPVALAQLVERRDLAAASQLLAEYFPGSP